MLTNEELELDEPEAKRLRTTEDVSENDGLILSQGNEEVAHAKMEPKEEVLNQLDDIEMLLSRLKEMYTREPTRFEETLIAQILKLLTRNMEGFE